MRQNVAVLSLRDLSPVDVPHRHQFELTDERPVYHSVQRLALKHNDVVQEELKEMLKAGIITPTSSAWSFPVVIATRKDGKPRFCVDYRVLDQRMKGDRFSLPKIQEIFDESAGGVFFTTLDLFSGYWQMKLEERCKQKTSFVCRQGTFQFEVMSFGLMNAPSTFQRMMNSLMNHLNFVRVYLDNLMIFSKTMSDHLENLGRVIELIPPNGLKLKISKCEFA